MAPREQSGDWDSRFREAAVALQRRAELIVAESSEAPARCSFTTEWIWDAVRAFRSGRALRVAEPPDGDGFVVRVLLTMDSVLVCIPGTQSCHLCLAERWSRLRSSADRALLGNPESIRSVADATTYSPFLAENVAAALSYAYSHRQVDSGVVIALDSLYSRWGEFEMERDRLCPLCGGGDPAEDSAPILPSQYKSEPNDFRARQLGAFNLDDKILTNPICGVIGDASRSGLDFTTSALVVGALNIEVEHQQVELNWSGQTSRYRDSAAAGAIEGLERYAGSMPRHRRSAVWGSVNTLGDRAIDPAAAAKYSEGFLRNNPWIHPFHSDLEFRWAMGLELATRRSVLVPEQFAYYYSAARHDNRFTIETSSGCASGSSLTEAALFGLSELIERDAFIVGWYGGATLTELIPDRLTSRRISTAIARAKYLGYRVRLYDNRLDVPLPVVTAVAERFEGQHAGDLVFASAAGFDPTGACVSALDEVLTYIPQRAAMSDQRREEVAAMRADYSMVTALRDHADLYSSASMVEVAHGFTEGTHQVSFGEAFGEWEDSRPRTEDLVDDLDYLVNNLSSKGISAYLVDQTTHEQLSRGLHCVAVIAPELVPVDFGWSHQRALYMDRVTTAIRSSSVLSGRTIKPRNAPHPFP